MKFGEWFEEQFGPDPCPDLPEAYKKERGLEVALHQIRSAINDKKYWDACRTAALYSWNIKDEDKK